MQNAFTQLPIAIIMYKRIKTTKREQKDYNNRCFRTPTKNINLNFIRYLNIKNSFGSFETYVNLRMMKYQRQYDFKL